MPVLQGEHYCVNHQGNTSHYSPDNCTVCRLLKENDELVEAGKQLGIEIAELKGQLALSAVARRID